MKASIPFPAGAAAAVAAIVLSVPVIHAQTSATDERLERALERFPEADADKDGVLTRAEADAYREKRRPRTPRSAPRPDLVKSDAKRYTVEELLAHYEAREFKGVSYRLMKPIDLDENPGKSYPLILSLHGAGGKGTGNVKNLRNWNGVLAEESLRRKHPCFVVVPQSDGPWRVPGPPPELSDETVATFPGIWRTTLQRRRGLALPDPESGNLDRVFELLDALAGEFNIDADRVYVLGHSMGGFGSWTAISEAPDRFAAAVPTAGGLSPWVKIRKIAGVPIWAFHGEKDSGVPPGLSRVVFEQLSEIGGNMKYSELKGVGHGVDGFAFGYEGDEPDKGFITKYSSERCDRTPGVWDWLFAQKRQ